MKISIDSNFLLFTSDFNKPIKKKIKNIQKLVYSENTYLNKSDHILI
jgi:hypothetical protein